jgi:parallel beta-helix repeat protein
MRNPKAQLSRRSVLAGVGVAIAGAVANTTPAFAMPAIGPGVAATAAADGTALADSHNPFDATAGALTVTLPTGQTQGTRMSVEKVDSSENPVTLSGNLRGIVGSTIPLVWQHETVELVTDSSGSWWPIAGHKAKSDLDATYAIVVNGNLYSSLSAALTAGCGRTVYMPAGYAATITSAITIPASTRLIFGTGSTLSVPNATVSGVFVMSDGSTLIGNGLVIDGGGAKSTDSKGIYALSVANVTVEGVTVQNWHGDAIHLRATDRARISNCYIDNVTYSDDFYGQGIRLTNASGGASTTNAIISGCHVRNCQGSGIQGDGQWNSSSWRTTGAKIQDCTITDCTAHSNARSGIWVNAGLRCTISDCHADNNGDYGVGYEFSQESVIDGCTASGNTTFGMALFQTNDRCMISNCTASANLTHGIIVKYLGQISGDTASTDSVIADCNVYNNALVGIWVENVIRTRVTGCNSSNNINGVGLTKSGDTTIEGCELFGNTSMGIRLYSNNSYTQIDACKINGSGVNGVEIDPTKNTYTHISSCMFRGNVAGSGNAILITAGATDTSIIGCTFLNNLHSIYGKVGSAQVEIIGCKFKGHSTFSVRALGVTDWRVVGNTFDEANSIALDLSDNAGTSGARLIVQNNVIKSGVNALKISAGSRVLASDYYVVADNTLIGPKPLVYSSMGSSAGVEFRGTGSGSPEGAIHGARGSIYRRTDGGAKTTLYVKETGVGSTGWIGK